MAEGGSVKDASLAKLIDDINQGNDYRVLTKQDYDTLLSWQKVQTSTPRLNFTMPQPRFTFRTPGISPIQRLLGASPKTKHSLTLACGM